MKNKENKSIHFMNGRENKSIHFMNGKKAWVRIAEASIASLILISAILFIMSRQQIKTSNIEDSIYEKQRQILDIISNNESLRKNVIFNEKTELNNMIQKIIPKTWGFSIAICKINEICSGETPYDRDVYTTETIITSALADYNPKKLRFFVWMK